MGHLEHGCLVKGLHLRFTGIGFGGMAGNWLAIFGRSVGIASVASFIGRFEQNAIFVAASIQRGDGIGINGSSFRAWEHRCFQNIGRGRCRTHVVSFGGDNTSIMWDSLQIFSLPVIVRCSFILISLITHYL